jgi:hypothetical protein
MTTRWGTGSECLVVTIGVYASAFKDACECIALTFCSIKNATYLIDELCPYR